MKVTNLKSSNGNAIPQQFEIEADNGDLVFQSYQTVIACKSGGKVTLDADMWDYSRTTGKYRNLFLHEDKAATERKIKKGEYTLANLN